MSPSASSARTALRRSRPSGQGQVLACSLRPMGGPFTEPLPDGLARLRPRGAAAARCADQRRSPSARRRRPGRRRPAQSTHAELGRAGRRDRRRARARSGRSADHRCQPGPAERARGGAGRAARGRRQRRARHQLRRRPASRDQRAGAGDRAASGSPASLSRPHRPRGSLMTWLVTGGAGYIGAHVVRAFRQAGVDVVVLDSLASGHRASCRADVPFVQGERPRHRARPQHDRRARRRRRRPPGRLQVRRRLGRQAAADLRAERHRHRRPAAGDARRPASTRSSSPRRPRPSARPTSTSSPRRPRPPRSRRTASRS